MLADHIDGMPEMGSLEESIVMMVYQKRKMETLYFAKVMAQGLLNPKSVGQSLESLTKMLFPYSDESVEEEKAKMAAVLDKASKEVLKVTPIDLPRRPAARRIREGNKKLQELMREKKI